MNLVTPKAGAKQELLFNIPASASFLIIFLKTLIKPLTFPCLENKLLLTFLSFEGEKALVGGTFNVFLVGHVSDVFYEEKYNSQLLQGAMTFSLTTFCKVTLRNSIYQNIIFNVTLNSAKLNATGIMLNYIKL
jgi:hypothetical protein